MVAPRCGFTPGLDADTVPSDSIKTIAPTAALLSTPYSKCMEHPFMWHQVERRPVNSSRERQFDRPRSHDAQARIAAQVWRLGGTALRRHQQKRSEEHGYDEGCRPKCGAEDSRLLIARQIRRTIEIRPSRIETKADMAQQCVERRFLRHGDPR